MEPYEKAPKNIKVPKSLNFGTMYLKVNARIVHSPYGGIIRIRFLGYVLSRMLMHTAPRNLI